ncbi:MAG: hypothetical protein PHT75_00520 [Bacilli bacterium]|nr:hypothetical protein [Bacilli bacterium]MDD3304601.1 hypothetical protein [Bacilli bacterium]MDD4053755.1 hypothetical protein [Bacilli bacterium]MDD4411658.1 hypothetical protein [Bacilli bacterium]
MKKAKIVILVVAVFISVGCGTNYEKLEKELSDKAQTYYEENVKQQDQSQSGTNGSYHTVTLQSLELSGVDITSFKDADCDSNSYAILKVLNNEIIDIEINITCGDYKTKTEDNNINKQ